MKRLYSFFILLFLFSCNNGRTVKFAVGTYVHQDLIYDVTESIQKFVSTAEKENADFVTQRGLENTDFTARITNQILDF